MGMVFGVVFKNMGWGSPSVWCLARWSRPQPSGSLLPPDDAVKPIEILGRRRRLRVAKDGPDPVPVCWIGKQHEAPSKFGPVGREARATALMIVHIIGPAKVVQVIAQVDEDVEWRDEPDVRPVCAFEHQPVAQCAADPMLGHKHPLRPSGVLPA